MKDYFLNKAPTSVAWLSRE